MLFDFDCCHVAHLKSLLRLNMETPKEVSNENAPLLLLMLVALVRQSCRL